MNGYRSNVKIPKPSAKLTGQMLRKVVYALPDSQLELLSGGELQLIRSNGTISRYDLHQIETILAFGQVQIDSYLIPQLLAFGVPISFFDRQGEHLGRLEPANTTRGDLLQAQANLAPEKRLRLAQQMAWGIARRARIFLARSPQKKLMPDEFKQASNELQIVCDWIFRHELEQVIGSIGRSFQIYYRMLPLLVPGWEFSGRKGKEPLNRMLDFVYALLEESCKSAVAAAGLNPSLGIWHADRTRHQPLVRDLVSEFKCFVDAVVIRSIVRQRITLKDFDGEWFSDSKLLPPQVAAVMVAEYTKKMAEEFQYPYLGFRCSYQEAISLQASQIAWYISGQIDDYFSLVLK